jgi:hypothetical protein
MKTNSIQVGAVIVAGLDYYALPILNTLVPHFGHTPCVAGLPFFIVIALGFLISTLPRHFIQ